MKAKRKRCRPLKYGRSDINVFPDVGDRVQVKFDDPIKGC